jgi:hypothetical protein
MGADMWDWFIELWAEWRPRRVLIGVFLLGLLIVWLSHLWGSEVTKEIGVAFMVAAILGVTIDEASKSELIRNGFFAAFRYAFPAPLQKEILRIAAYRMICERHYWRVNVEKIDHECVRVTCELRRKIRNIGSSAEKVRPRIHIDDWGFAKERSEIFECKLEVPGRPTITATAKEADYPTILVEGREAPIKPDDPFTITSKWKEIKRHSDLVYITFSAPTVDPEIDVQLPEGFKAQRSFGSASEAIEELSTGREVVRGTYLPHHYMIVRWWPAPKESQAAPAPKIDSS